MRGALGGEAREKNKKKRNGGVGKKKVKNGSSRLGGAGDFLEFLKKF